MCLCAGLLHQAQACITHGYAILETLLPGQKRDEYGLYTKTLEARLRCEHGEFSEALRLNRELLFCLRTTDVRVWPHVPEVGTLFLEANVCHALGWVTWHTGQYDAAQRWLRESLAIRARLGEERHRAHGLRMLADMLCLTGQTDEAERLAKEGLALNKAHRDRIGVGWGHAAQGAILLIAGRFAEAQARFSESLAIAQGCGHQEMMARALNGLAAVAFARADLDEAGRLYEESCASFERLEVVAQRYAASGDRVGKALPVATCPRQAHFMDALAAPRAAWERWTHRDGGSLGVTG
jgi:tetratricopeptide (TPR) repeat protein